MTEPDLRAAIAAERAELADVLGRLDAKQWDAPSLCDGWRVREVVAHLTMPFCASPVQWVAELVRSAGRFDHMADRCARRDARRLSAAQLTAVLAENLAHPWKPPGAGHVAALSHDVIHGLDITVALGLDRKIPHDRLRKVLNGQTDKHVRYFGVDLDGIQLQADDVDWTWGTGAPLTGTAQHLLLVLCGRTLPPGHLRGAPRPVRTRLDAQGRINPAHRLEPPAESLRWDRILVWRARLAADAPGRRIPPERQPGGMRVGGCAALSETAAGSWRCSTTKTLSRGSIGRGGARRSLQRGRTAGRDR